ncbi:MAG: DUF4105 domain-containing protein [Phycisphaerales bacterium]|nr:DUF4105 domain-containing protein [Phycisphaerales bacterium]
MKSILAQFILLILLSQPLFCFAQQHDTTSKGIHISLLTCGPGQEIYSVFGHTAIRMVDSNRGTDIVYNYGTFDGYDKDFEINFMRGKLLYYLSEERYEEFMALYQTDKRWVTEQLLNINDAEKKQIQAALLKNKAPENRAYKYDFFFDNCATRIRDILSKTEDGKFKYPNVLAPNQSLSFRDIINRYLANNAWERLGINILLGSKIDKKMSNNEIMFLPDYLRDGIDGATLNGKKFAQASRQILVGTPESKPTNIVLWIVLYGLLALVLVGTFFRQFHWVSTIISNLLLITTGLLGILILIMWLGTNHQTCSNNLNLLWALPTNLMFVFRKQRYKYAVIAIIMLLLSFLLHILQVQCLLLPEMLPILLILFITYGGIYNKYKID